MAQNAFGQPQYGSNAIGGGGGNAAARERERRRRNRRRQQQNGGSGLAGGGGAGGAGGGNPAGDGDGMTEIPYVPGTMASSGSLTKPVTATNSYGNTGANPLDLGSGSNDFNDPNFRSQNAWGLLNQAGIVNDGSGDALFVDDLVNNWINAYEGLSATENPNLTYENFLYGLIGDSPAATVTSPTPVTINRNGRITTGETRGGGAPRNALPATPGTEQWRQQVYYPTMNQEIQRAIARATPTQRRRDMSRWTGTGTTVAFG